MKEKSISDWEKNSSRWQELRKIESWKQIDDPREIAELAASLRSSGVEFLSFDMERTDEALLAEMGASYFSGTFNNEHILKIVISEKKDYNIYLSMENGAVLVSRLHDPNESHLREIRCAKLGDGYGLVFGNNPKNEIGEPHFTISYTSEFDHYYDLPMSL